LLGFTKISQIEENIGGLKVFQEKWNPELEERLEKLLANGPEE